MSLRRKDHCIIIRCGINSVAVSNHAGRQVDSQAASLDALGCVVNPSGTLTTILFDSGMGSAADMSKVLALGVQVVFVGRLGIWGLGVVG